MLSAEAGRVAEIVSPVGLVHERRFEESGGRDRRGTRICETDHVVIEPNHARVLPAVVAAAEIKISLTVIVDETRRIEQPGDVGIGKVLGHQCCSDRIDERAAGIISHGYTNRRTAVRHVEVILAAFAASTWRVQIVSPREIVRMDQDSVILPIDHIVRRKPR